MDRTIRIIPKGFILVFFILFFSCCMSIGDTLEYEFSVAASSPSQDSIYIRWESKTTRGSYQIFWQSNNTEEYEYLATINNSNSYTDTGLQPSTRYSYKIAYRNGNDVVEFIGDSFFAVTQPHLIAHRGFWGFDGIPENSIASLQAAAELEVYGSEFDVHLTADNVPVVYHDYVIEGTDIYISEVTYNKIRDIVLPNGERVPTLDEYLEAAKALPIRLILDLKSYNILVRDREAARLVIDRVKYYGLEDRVEYIAFNLETGKELICLQPDSNVGYLNGDLVLAELKKYGFSTLAYPFETIQSNPQYITEAKELGLAISAWTVNDLSLMESLNNLGVGFIITDIPLQAKEYFKQRVYQYYFN